MTTQIDSATRSDEPLLNEDNSRLTVYPIKHPDIFQFYKTQRANAWQVEELDLSQDKGDYEKLNGDEKHFIKYILAFFAASDTLVNMNLLERFSREVKILEAQMAYIEQAAGENVHSETYSLLIETLIDDKKEKEYLFDAIKNIPCITEKANWTLKWIASDASFAKRLIAFAIVEGVFFSGSFCAIYWLKDQKNCMPGFTLSNEWISRDEGVHTDFACFLYSNYIVNKLPESEVHDMMRDSVGIETKFICDSLPCDLIAMNSEAMTEYIQYVADRLLVSLGYNKIWNHKKCPFEFMEKLSLQKKGNFFEKRIADYQIPSINDDKKGKLEVLDDF